MRAMELVTHGQLTKLKLYQIPLLVCKRMAPLMGAMFFLFPILLIQELRPQKPATEGVVFDFNEGFSTFSSDSLRFMSFGYSRIWSNLLWLRFLQHTPPKNMGQNQVSWIYLDLDAISSLDPEFYPVFEKGAVFLSVITEDKRGAELLLQKGIQLFPNEWVLYSYLAYHYQFELKRPKEAAEAYEKAAQFPGASPLMGLIAASYKAESQGHYMAIEFLKQLRDANSDPRIRGKFETKIMDLINGTNKPIRSHY